MQILDLIRPYHSFSIKDGNPHLWLSNETTCALMSLYERKVLCVFQSISICKRYRIISCSFIFVAIQLIFISNHVIWYSNSVISCVVVFHPLWWKYWEELAKKNGMMFTLISARVCFAATSVHTDIILFLFPHFSYLDQVYKNALTSTATN